MASLWVMACPKVLQRSAAQDQDSAAQDQDSIAQCEPGQHCTV
jgi:hypothetical protein